MEDRWLARRHKETEEQVEEGERLSAMAAWAERRARIEEEMSRNAEAIRYQSALQQQEYIVPSDAAEDIEATNVLDTDDSAANQTRLPAPLVRSTRRPGSAPAHTPSHPPLYDVSRIEPLADTEVNVPEQPRRPGSRLSFLRKIHSHLLEAVEDPVIDTLPRTEHACGSLQTLRCLTRAHGFDAAERRDLETGEASARPSSPSLDELRFKQMQEAEAVKRALDRRKCSVNASVVDTAMVMPDHRRRLRVGLFNHGPNLLENPFPEEVRAKKRRPKGGKVVRRRVASARR